MGRLCPFIYLQVCKRVEISQVEVCESREICHLDISNRLTLWLYLVMLYVSLRVAVPSPEEKREGGYDLHLG